jgi:integrase
MEGLRLRVKDVDFLAHQITVREGKGSKDRVTMLPVKLEEG